MIQYNFAVVIPTYNAGSQLEVLLNAIKSQKLQPATVVIIDSSSTDGSTDIVKNYNCNLITIPKEIFNHGRTRQYALSGVQDCSHVIYLTQDSIPQSQDAFFEILKPFSNKSVGAVCGRQIPHNNANPIARHARQFNYPAVDSMFSYSDIKSKGLKAAFMSNSFAAYALSALNEVGGFPGNVIFGEDMYVAAKMLLSNYQVAYAAEATTAHSHNYSLKEEFQRYFDIGVFHQKERWSLREFGSISGDGFKYATSEWLYLLKNHEYRYLLKSPMYLFSKLMGYQLGKIEAIFGSKFSKYLSMNKAYWDRPMFNDLDESNG